MGLGLMSELWSVFAPCRKKEERCWKREGKEKSEKYIGIEIWFVYF